MDTLMKNIFFSKMFSLSDGNIFYSFLNLMGTYFLFICDVLVVCTARAPSSMHHKLMKDMFRNSAKYFLNFKNSPMQFWEHFWNKYLFHPRVPPLVSEDFLVLFSHKNPNCEKFWSDLELSLAQLGTSLFSIFS